MNYKLIARRLRAVAEELERWNKISDDNQETLKKISDAIKRNPELLCEFCEDPEFGDHDGWYDSIVCNTSLNSVLKQIKNKIELNFDPKNTDDNSNLVQVLTEYGVDSNVFYIFSSPDFENHFTIIPFPDVTKLPSREEPSQPKKGYVEVFDGMNWLRENTNDVPFYFGNVYGTSAHLYKEDFIDGKNFFLE